MLTFILVVVVIVSVIVVAFNHRAFRNPRQEWDRKHASEVKGGEPTEDALAKIQNRALLGMILGPILVTVTGGVGYLKFEQQEKKNRERVQQNQRDTPFPKEFGKNADIKILEKLPPLDAKQQAMVQAQEKEQQRLHGAWTLISLETNGKPHANKEEKQQLTFSGASWSLRKTSPPQPVKWDPTKKSSSQLTQFGALRWVDHAADPKAVDLVKTQELSIVKDPALGELAFPIAGEATFLAIYRIDGDKLHLCQGGPAGKERPKEFATREGDGFTYSVWQRHIAKAEFPHGIIGFDNKGKPVSTLPKGVLDLEPKPK